MRNSMTKALGAVLALEMWSCVSPMKPQERPDIAARNARMPNPFYDCKTWEDAEDCADFEFAPPSHKPEWIDMMRIRAIRKSMIEALYLGSQQREMRIRKGKGHYDISGVYGKFDDVTTVKVQGRDVTMKGKGDLISVATWYEGPFTYAITATKGLPRKLVETMAAEMR